MNALGLEFRFDLLGFEPRPFAGALDVEQVRAAVGGLVGDLGYHVAEPAQVRGTAVRTAGGEVVVNGGLSVELGFDCVRCLTRRALTVALDGQYVLVKRRPSADGLAKEEVEFDAAALDAPEDYTFDGETVQLADLFREELVLAVGMNPHCADADGAGADAECSAPADTQAPEATIDPRWAPLLALKQKLSDDSSES